MLTTQIWTGSHCFKNIKCQNGPKIWLLTLSYISQIVHNKAMAPFLKKKISETAYENAHGIIVISVFLWKKYFWNTRKWIKIRKYIDIYLLTFVHFQVFQKISCYRQTLITISPCVFSYAVTDILFFKKCPIASLWTI